LSELIRLRLPLALCALCVLLGCASNPGDGSFSKDPGPIAANLIGALQEGEDPNLVPEVQRNFLKGCVTGASDSIPDLVAIQETGLLSVCGCSYTRLVEHFKKGSTALLDSSALLSEIENDAYERFKELDEDFKKGEKEFNENLLEIFQTCIRDSSPTVSS